MANQQHIDWLLEGVEAWSIRRAAETFQPDFEDANIRGAFEEAGMLNAFGRFNLTTADFIGADLRGANVQSFIYAAAGTNDAGAAAYTGLSSTINLTQAQVDEMKGDSGTILPPHITRPDHWPVLEQDIVPELPRKAPPASLSEADGQLHLSAAPPPNRDDLHTIFDDLREDLQTLKSSGSFNNISKGFDSVFTRFVALTDCAYGELDQIRFGVQSSSLRNRFDAQRDEIDQIAADKTGDLEAILLTAELISAACPNGKPSSRKPGRPRARRGQSRHSRRGSGNRRGCDAG